MRDQSTDEAEDCWTRAGRTAVAAAVVVAVAVAVAAAAAGERVDDCASAIRGEDGRY